MDDIEKTVELYADMILRIAVQNTQNRSDAEDIMQEVFLRLVKAPNFRDESHRKAWLIRVTINLSKNLKKSFWHRHTEPLPEEIALTDTERGVMEELWSLPKSYRNTLYLYYYEGYTVPEIARLLGKGENTVSSWLTRARSKLKKLVLEGEAER